MESLKAKGAHLPALPCADMESLRRARYRTERDNISDNRNDIDSVRHIKYTAAINGRAELKNSMQRRQEEERAKRCTLYVLLVAKREGELSHQLLWAAFCTTDVYGFKSWA